MHLRLTPRHHLAVEPDETIAVVIGDEIGHELRSLWSGGACLTADGATRIRATMKRTLQRMQGRRAETRNKSIAGSAHARTTAQSRLRSGREMTCHVYRSTANKSTWLT
jgi:hypothetical protein